MATKPKKPKKKPKTLKQQAKELSNAEYAGVIGQIGDTRTSGRNQYDRFTKDRQDSLARQIGSDRQTGEITGNVITGLRGESIGALDKAIAARNAATSARNETIQAQNSEALSNFEAEMKARGLDAGAVEGLKQGMATQQGYRGRLSEIEAQGAEDQKSAAGRLYDVLSSQNETSKLNAEARAKAAAQADFSKQYGDYLTKDEALAADLAKAKKDRGSSYLNTYMTLKKEYQQRKAEEAANKLSAAVSMGKQASSDYFKQARLDLDTQKFGLDTKKFEQQIMRDIQNGTISQAKAIKDLKAAGMTMSEINSLLGIKPKSPTYTKPPRGYGSNNPSIGR